MLEPLGWKPYPRSQCQNIIIQAECLDRQVGERRYAFHSLTLEIDAFHASLDKFYIFARVSDRCLDYIEVIQTACRTGKERCVWSRRFRWDNCDRIFGFIQGGGKGWASPSRTNNDHILLHLEDLSIWESWGFRIETEILSGSIGYGWNS